MVYKSMYKVFFFYCYKDKYYYSTPIINNFKILHKMKKDFLEKNIEMISVLEFLPQYNKERFMHDVSVEQLHIELMNAMENIIAILPDIAGKYEKIIFLGFHPVSLAPFIKYYTELKKYANIKIILWQDDLHAFFKTPESQKKLDYVDHIMSPSPIYFKNTTAEYLSKTSFFFYSIDFTVNDGYYVKWENRQNKIILSGCVSKGYPIRAIIRNEIRKNKKFKEISYFLEKPREKEYEYKGDKVLPYGDNYYKELGKFKGAFFGYYLYPKNFNLAKIIEILSMGCIGFFEYSPLLEKELGLIEMIHYVPCTNKETGKLIIDVEYYKYYLENKEGKGKMISENGRDYVRKNFSITNGFENYVRILNNI